MTAERAAPRHRLERWGAWVRTADPPMLVGLDRHGAAMLGLDGGALWGDAPDAASAASAPLEVHLAVTARCAAGCEGCYLEATPDGAEPSRAELEGRLEAIARAGAFTVALGGGEPTTRKDLGALADRARALGLSPVVTTSGLGLGERKLADLARFDQVNVSYDGDSAAYAAVRGFDGASEAEAAIRALAAAGVRVGANVVLTRATFDRLADTARRAIDAGAGEIQLLRYKPAGRAASPDYLARRLSPAQVERFPAELAALARRADGAARVRIDCALVPFLSTADLDPRALERFGIYGCEAAQSLAAARVDGRVAPCSFAEPSGLDVTSLDDGAARGADAPLAAYRAAPSEDPCRACPMRAVCKGGCKVVARHLGAGLGPDPECPRVRRARGR